MSVIADAVKRADLEKCQKEPGLKSPSKKPWRVLLTVSAVIFVLLFALTALYVHEESKISSLREELAKSRLPANELISQNQGLLREKAALENQLNAQNQKAKKRIDELLGKAKILQYEKETMESDNSQKVNKITELQAQIEKQDERETLLMTLIEDAKKQIQKQDAALEAAKSAPQSKAVPDAVSEAASSAG